jgi:hypothetical protein
VKAGLVPVRILRTRVYHRVGKLELRVPQDRPGWFPPEVLRALAELEGAGACVMIVSARK